MKICILTPRFPFPENGGDVLRINNIARYLKEKKHTLVLVSFIESCQNEEDNNIFDKLYTVPFRRKTAYCNSVKSILGNSPIQVGYYSSKKYYSLLKNIVEKEKPELYISHLLRMTPYLYKLGVKDRSIIEMTDALSRTYDRAGTSPGFSIKKFIYTIEKSRIQKYEKKVISDFRKVVLVSDSDKEYLGNSKSLYVYPNGTFLNESFSGGYNKGKIIFVGNMRTLQNQDAVFYFVREIFPKILMKNQNVSFHIVGANPSEKIKELDNENNIFVTGFVKDIYDVIKDACVAVAPVRIAAGMQNKVLLSMSAKIPVVLSYTISSGIPGLISEKNCLIAKNTSEYVLHLNRILSNEILRTNIAQSGFEFVRDNYSWDKMLEGYERFSENIRNICGVVQHGSIPG